MNPNPPICDVCGAVLDPATPGGLCPRCLMAGAMQPTQPSAGAERPEPPDIVAVQAAFPHLDILQFIGQGGMGWVFKARQPKLNRLVALKLLPSSLAERDPAFAGRFDREGQLLARLHHPNIVAVHDSGTTPGFFYLLMEFVDGVNLRQAMRSSRFTAAQALAIVPHICDALQFAHDEGVLHRDIKPENILLDAKGRVKLVDFGIAKLVGAGAEPGGAGGPEGDPALNLTQSGATLGTPSYMAPEQRDTPSNVDHRADIYSLGVVFYELLTGELPTGSFAPPSSMSDSDPRVDAIVQQALQKERTRRQNSAGEMKTQVQTVSAEPMPAKPTEYSLFHPEGIVKFRSITALRFAQAACLGFLGFLGAIPGWERMHGLFGLFGLIGAAYGIEAASRKGLGRTGWITMGVACGITLLLIFGRGVFAYWETAPVPAALIDLSQQSFGPTLERDITIGNDSHSFYSLDRGDYVPGPTDFTPSAGDAGLDTAEAIEVQKTWRWLTANDVDFLATRNSGRPGLVLSDMVWAMCNEADFDAWTPANAARDAGFQAALKEMRRASYTKPLGGNQGGKVTLIFQTRYDRIGMVQVMGVTSNPPGVRIRYKMAPNSEPVAATASKPSATASPPVYLDHSVPSPTAQSKRQRFAPVAGMPNLTNWGTYDKPSIWNPDGWAIVARMTLGGVVNARVPGQPHDFCQIKLTGGNDDEVTLDIHDLEANHDMTVTLNRDQHAELTVNGAGYGVTYSGIYVATDQPDTTPFAFIVVTHADSTPPAQSSLPVLGPVHELVIHPADPNSRAIDLTAGTFIPGRGLDFSPGREDTLSAAGVDLYVPDGEPLGVLKALDMRQFAGLYPQRGQPPLATLDSITAQELADLLRYDNILTQDAKIAGTGYLLPGRTQYITGNNLYVFHTRATTAGVLQITGTQASPPGVTISLRLLHGAPLPAPGRTQP